MANRSDIEWTESTWNPLTGCTKIILRTGYPIVTGIIIVGV